MSDIYELEIDSINRLKEQFNYDDHFISIVWPRLKLIHSVKELLSEASLQWKIKYKPTNKAENEVIISLIDERKKFHFYYSIPLTIGLAVKLYLGDNTFNYFEAQPLLINNNVIKEGEFKVSATVNSLPHLVLSQRSDRYEFNLLNNEYSQTDIESSTIYKLLKQSFDRFNAPLYKIISGEYQL